MKAYLKPVMAYIGIPCEDLLTAFGATELFEMDKKMVVQWENLK